MPLLYIYIAGFLFIAGLFIGSFLNVLVDRPQGDLNPLTGRSVCDYCMHKLSCLDLIPVISFAFLSGKCRYCHKNLSAYYPITEIVTGVLFVLVFYILTHNGLNFQLSALSSQLEIIYYLLITSILIVIFFTDLKYGIIPFKAVLLGIIAVALWHMYFPLLNFTFVNYVYSGIGAFTLFLIIFLITKGRGMGFGDVVYVFFMGFLVGFPNIILSLYFAFLSGAVISILLVILKKKKLRGSTIPFGPFLVTGTLVSLLWGNLLSQWVLISLFGKITFGELIQYVGRLF